MGRVARRREEERRREKGERERERERRKGRGHGQPKREARSLSLSIAISVSCPVFSSGRFFLFRPKFRSPLRGSVERLDESTLRRVQKNKKTPAGARSVALFPPLPRPPPTTTTTTTTTSDDRGLSLARPPHTLSVDSIPFSASLDRDQHLAGFSASTTILSG